MIVENMPAGEYHNAPAWGAHSLKAMRKGPPARVLWERDNRVESDAMAFGTALHMAVLQPDIYAAIYVAKPDGMSFATKEGKAWREDHQGFLILTHAEAVTINAMCLSLSSKPLVYDAFRDALHREASIFWTDRDTGEACKGRADCLDGRYLYDLKVSRYAGGDLAYRAFVDGWMHQLAHYRSGCEANDLGVLGARLIVIHPLPPHYVYTLEIKSDALDLLAIENSQTLYAMKQCREADDWPGTPDQWTLIEPPASALIASAVNLDAIELVEET